jgi:hypothetical protein
MPESCPWPGQELAETDTSERKLTGIISLYDRLPAASSLDRLKPRSPADIVRTDLAAPKPSLDG